MQLRCELCGETNIIKQDGSYLCQTCGAKYSVEEARKMMMGNVNPVAETGFSKPEQTSKTKNLYQLARMEIDKAGCGNAQKYYEDILPEDPNSWEAHFFVEYTKCWNAKVRDIQTASTAFTKCLEYILNLIKNHVNNPQEQEEALSIVCMRTEKLFKLILNAAKEKLDRDANQDVYLPEYRAPRAEEVFRAKVDSIANQQAATAQFYDNFDVLLDMLMTLGDSIDRIFADHDRLNLYAAKPWKLFLEYFLPLATGSTSIPAREKASEYVAKVRKYDTEYEKCDLPQNVKNDIEKALRERDAALAVKIYRNYTGKRKTEAAEYVNMFSVLNGINTNGIANANNAASAESRIRSFGIMGLTPYTFIAGIFTLCFTKKAREENDGKLSRKSKRWMIIGVGGFFLYLLLYGVLFLALV